MRWQFNAQDAWPRGFTMICRSLDAQTQMQRNLFKAQPLTSREALLDFVTLVANDKPDKSGDAPFPTLLELLKQCREQKTLTPLLEQRRMLAKKKQLAESNRVAVVDRLLKLLRVSPAAAGGE